MTIKALSVVSALFLSAFASAQDLTKPITYTTKAVPLRMVLDELSKQGGIKLKCESALEEEPLILRLNAVPLQQVMDKMANVFAADWTDHGDYKELDRSDEKEAAIKGEILKERIQGIKDSIAELQNLEAQAPPMDEQHADQLMQQFLQLGNLMKNGQSPDVMRAERALESQEPSMKLGVKLLATLNPSELAAIPDGGEITYTSPQTGSTRPLAPLTEGDLKQFFRERDAFSAAVQKAKIGEDSPLFFALQDYNHPMTSKPASIRCTARRMGKQVLVFFDMLDDKGVTLMSDGEGVGMPWDYLLTARQKNPALEADARKQGFALSPVAAEIVERYGQPAGQLRPMSEDARNALLSPTKVDPLALATSDIILNGAQQDGLNAIVLAPDSVDDSAMSAARSGKVTLARFQNSLVNEPVTMSVSDGWLVLKPVDPDEASTDRLARPALEQLVRQTLDDGYASIETACDFAVQTHSDHAFLLAEKYQSLLFPTEGMNPLQDASPSLLRFYGSMSPQQRDAAQQGGLSLTWDSLSAEQQQTLSDWLMNPSLSTVEDTKASGSNRFSLSPTEVLPDTVPADTVIDVTDAFTDTFYPVYSAPSGNTFTDAATLEDVAYQIVMQQHPDLFPDNPNVFRPKATGFRLGKQRKVSVNVTISGRYKVSEYIPEDHPASGNPLTTQQLMDSLPDAERAQLEQLVQKTLDQMTKYRQQQGLKGASSDPGGVQPPRT